VTIREHAVSEIRRAFLGLGSNMGDRHRYLRDAVDSLGGVVAVSPVYETEPLGGGAQDPYLNCVVELATDLTPHQLLGVCHRLESAAERIRGPRFGPRTLDVDVLLVGDLVVDEPDLVVPHPRMWSRRFVLVPLSDLASELVPPDLLVQAEGHVELVGPLDPHPRSQLR